MTATELEQFTKMDIKLGTFIDKTVRVISNTGWVEGTLHFSHCWYVTAPNLEYSFDTEEVSSVHKNYLYLLAKSPYLSMK